MSQTLEDHFKHESTVVLRFIQRENCYKGIAPIVLSRFGRRSTLIEAIWRAKQTSWDKNTQTRTLGLQINGRNNGDITIVGKKPNQKDLRLEYESNYDGNLTIAGMPNIDPDEFSATWVSVRKNLPGYQRNKRDSRGIIDLASYRTPAKSKEFFGPQYAHIFQNGNNWTFLESEIDPLRLIPASDVLVGFQKNFQDYYNRWLATKTNIGLYLQQRASGNFLPTIAFNNARRVLVTHSGASMQGDIPPVIYRI